MTNHFRSKWVLAQSLQTINIHKEALVLSCSCWLKIYFSMNCLIENVRQISVSQRPT